jgi:hypothetical protein
MLIQALITPKRPPERANDPFPVTIGNGSYTFARDAQGRFVCEVHLKPHIDMFLAREDAYVDTGEGERTAVEPTQSQAKRLKNLRRTGRSRRTAA